MADTDDKNKSPETAAPAPLKNDGTPTPAPATDNKSNPDVEQARREAEQARMRAQQLENELKAEREKREADERKKLEDKEEWKTLAEKSQAELKELRTAQEESARQTALKTATDVLFKDYPENIVEVAKTTGLSLSDDSEAAKTALKEKLDTIKEKMGSGSPVSANNPHNPAPTEVNREELVTRAKPGAESPMAMAGATGDDSVARKYIGSLDAVKTMRKQAGLSE